MTNNRARAWVWVLNNYTDEEMTSIDVIECEYVIYGKEVGKSGTKHLQGYIYWKNAKSFNAVQRILPRAHLEPAKGSADENKTYCSKDGDVTERGVLPNQGRRSDIQSVILAVSRGDNMRSILLNASSYQSARMGELALKYMEPTRKVAPDVLWFWGPTGVGKTHMANEIFKEGDTPYWVYDGKWWCGYDGHKNVVWDEFRADQVKFSRLLRLLDKWPIAVEVKGGQRQLVAEKIIITCNKHPKDVYDKSDEEVQQLLRRIKEVRHFSELLK